MVVSGVAKKTFNKKTDEQKQQELKELVDKLESQVQQVTHSREELIEYLGFMTNFYDYSFKNSMLIQQQFPGAVAVGSYKKWQDLGVQVKEKSKIKIFRGFEKPSAFKTSKGEWKAVSKATEKEEQMISNGDLEVSQTKVAFIKGDVWDISQTDTPASELPRLFPNKWLEGKVENYEGLKVALEVYMENIGVSYDTVEIELGSAKGYYRRDNHSIALNPRNSELQNVKTLVHELSHATLHKKEGLTSAEMEFQAELTAVSVCKHFGLDTTDYSLDYLYGWTKSASFEDKQLLLEHVYGITRTMVETIEQSFIQQQEQTQFTEFVKMYELENDQAFTEEDIQLIMTNCEEKQEIYQAIQAHRSGKILDWRYEGELSEEEIDQYEEDLQLNLRSKLFNGHLFYQVGEGIELMLSVSDNSPSEYHGRTFDETGQIVDFQIGSFESAEKLLKKQKAIAVSEDSMTGLVKEGKQVSKSNYNKQQQIMKNQVMQNTYQKQTGKSMTRSL